MIFYFTATGNSLSAAMMLGEALHEDLVNMAEAIRVTPQAFQIGPDERIGFVFPVYFYGVPSLVEEFISKATFSTNPNPYVFAVFTCGANIAGADKQFSELLAKRGQDVSASFVLPMVNNAVIWSELPSLSAQDAALASAEKEIGLIAHRIRQKETGGYTSGIFGRLTTKVAYPMYEKGRKTGKFLADDSCISCNLCEQICPVQAIEMEDGKPRWITAQCVQCLGCINRCPVSAIQYGAATKKRRRFVNPILKKAK